MLELGPIQLRCTLVLDLSGTHPLIINGYPITDNSQPEAKSQSKAHLSCTGILAKSSPSEACHTKPFT